MTASLHAMPLFPGTVRLWNALSSHVLPVRITLDNGQPSEPVASLTCPVTQGDMSTTAAYTLYVNLNGFWRLELGNLDIMSVRPELAEWLQADAANRFAQLPEGLIRAVLERLFLPVLDGISRRTGMPAIFVGAPRASTRPMFTEYLDVVLRVQGKYDVVTPLRIAWQDTATLSPLVERVESLPLRHPPAAVAAADLMAHVVIGRMRLTLPELRSLGVGDILLPQILTPREPRVRLGAALCIACVLDDATLTVRSLETPAEPVPHGEQHMSQNAAENSASAQGSGQAGTPLLGQDTMGNLELDIVFELPQLRLSLAECGRLAPGYTFTLAADAAHLPVAVKAGGSVVAVGRLVEVDGTVGVQVTQVSDKATQAGGSTGKDGA